MTDVLVPPPPPPPPPPAPPVTPGVPPGSFDFGKPFTYVFDDPRWLQKILLGGLFYLASLLLIGLPFLFGYVAQVTRNVAAGHERPLPEWDDLGGFFSEGLRLLGVSVCYFIPFMILIFALVIPAGIADSVDNEGLRSFAGMISGCFSCLMVPLVLLMMFFLPGSLLFAMMEQNFGAAFDFKRIWSLIKNNIGNYLLAFLIYWIAHNLGGIGVILLCVGVIFTGFWSFLITAHAYAQVWRLAPR
jgi:Protein of unknown function (DUF4013)